jgi:hypothetical protein
MNWINLLKKFMISLYANKDVLHFYREMPFNFGATSIGVREVLRDFVADGGYACIGFYHKYGCKPFLEYFNNLREKGRKEQELYDDYRRLNPHVKDEVRYDHGLVIKYFTRMKRSTRWRNLLISVRMNIVD